MTSPRSAGASINPQKAEAVSAGTQPGVRVHPEVQTVMQGVGIDLSGSKPQKFTRELTKSIDLIITIGLRRQVPLYPWSTAGRLAASRPKGLPIEEARAIRDEIAHRVQSLLRREDYRLVPIIAPATTCVPFPDDRDRCHEFQQPQRPELSCRVVRGYGASARTTAPAAISPPPTAFSNVSRSPRKIHAPRITSTTLNLSIGATLEAGPICSARK